uniref:Microtubule-associated protein futsch n=1 Tax=Ascaris lumbricoides TaxID=6252 RepID=A0A0M3HWU4_ASCLU
MLGLSIVEQTMDRKRVPQGEQPKEDATLLANDHNGMDELGFEIDSNHLDETKDFIGVPMHIPHQPTAAQLENNSHLSTTTATLPPTTTFPTTTEKTTNIAGINTSIKNNNDVNSTITAASASGGTSDPGRAATFAKPATTVDAGVAPTSAATKPQATKSRDSKSKTITSENPIRNEQEPVKATFVEETGKMGKHADDKGEKMGSSHDGQLPRIDEASEFNENGERIHSEINDNEYSLLTVKDSDGKVISNQATMDFKKFERFIERMREDIHRIVEMEANRSAEMMNKTKIIDGNVTSDFRHGAAVREHNITHTAEKHHFKKEKKFIDSTASGQPQTNKQNYESNATTTGEKIRSEEGNFSRTETSKKDDPLPREIDDYKMTEAIEKLESGQLRNFQNIENRVVGKEQTTNEKGPRPFTEGDGGKLPQEERRTNDRGEVVHTEVYDASGFRTIPSTRHFTEDVFGNPTAQQDKNGKPLVEDDRGKLQVTERITNEKGEVVHSELISDDFTILQVTDKMGNKLSGEELRGEAKKESSEEDDFFVEESEIKTSIPTITKAQHSVDQTSDSERSGVLKKTINFSYTEHHVNEMNATNVQKGGTKHNDKEDERRQKEKNGSTKHKTEKNEKNTKDSERQTSDSKKMDKKNNATNSKSDHQKIGRIDKDKQNNQDIKKSTSSRNNHHEAQKKKGTNQSSTDIDEAAESVKSQHKEQKEEERKQGNTDMKKAAKSKKGHHGKQKKKERKEKSKNNKKNEKRKQKKPKAQPLKCLNETEVDLGVHLPEKRTNRLYEAGFSVANETSLIDDLSVHLWNLEQRNRTIDLKRLGDDPLDEEAPLYRMEDGAEPATAPPAPNFGLLKDDEIRAKADSLRSNTKHDTLSGGRASAHSFEETLAVIVAYNDTDFS